MDTEIEIIISCARTHIRKNTLQKLESLFLRDVNFEKLFLLATTHRVKPLLYYNLNKYAPNILSHPSLVPLEGECRRISLHNMFLANELIEISENLENHGIRVISFKGPILASRYGDLSLRQIKDLDLLISKDDLQRAVELLIAQGYQSIVKVPWETHLASPKNSITGTYSIDLHQDIVPKHLSCFSSSDDLWSAIEPYTILDKKVNTFTPEILVLVLCLNGTKEGWCRLNRVCDVAELIRAHSDMDWQHVIKTTHTLGIKRLVSLGLLLAKDLLGAELPPVVSEMILSDQSVPILTNQISKKILNSTVVEEPGEIERTFFHIRTRERWQDKLKSLLGLMEHSGWMNITENDRTYLQLPTHLYFLYYVIRPIRIFSKYISSSKSQFSQK